MNITNCSELYGLASTLDRKTVDLCNYTSERVKMDNLLTTDLNGDQLTEMTALIAAKVAEIATAYTTLSGAFAGY